MRFKLQLETLPQIQASNKVATTARSKAAISRLSELGQAFSKNGIQALMIENVPSLNALEAEPISYCATEC